MEHVVFFPASDGSPAFRRLPSLDEAVSFVEHLRNERDVAEVSVHSLSAVPLAFRTVYRVEVAGEVPAPSAPADVPAPSAPADVPADADSVAAEAPVAEAVDGSAADAAVDPVADVASDTSEAPAERVAAASGDAKTLGFFAS